MLESLSFYLHLFEDWLRLFPTKDYSEVSETIIKVFLEYIAFVVDAILYLRKSQLSKSRSGIEASMMLRVNSEYYTHGFYSLIRGTFSASRKYNQKDHQQSPHIS